jgi:hypothetical protein
MPNHSEKGNVLFLILIAVTLFAALSYAVTSSTRSGSGDTSAETLKLQYSTIQSYVSAMRSELTRMIVGGIAAEDINFFHPEVWPFVPNPAVNVLQRNLFHPSAGGLPFQHLGIDKTSPRNSQVVAIYEIQGIGTTTGTNSGIDVIYGITVSESFCNYINKRIGYNGSIPYADMFSSGYTDGSISDNGYFDEIITGFSMPLQFEGKNEGCIYDGTYGYFYYTTLLER